MVAYCLKELVYVDGLGHSTMVLLIIFIRKLDLQEGI